MKALRKGVAGALLFLALPVFGSEISSPFAAQAETNLAKAASHAAARPDSLEAAWQLARACFDAAEYAENNSERAEIAQRGIEAAKKAMTIKNDSCPAHYYLGMNLGQLARTKTLGALRLVDQMVVEFSRARELDERFDYAGPDRNLGLLYRDAPSIASVGDRAKARRHLQRAVLLEPNYPENRLNLAESYQQWGENEPAAKQLNALTALLPQAREKLVGPEFGSAWADWDKRLEAVKAKAHDRQKKLSAPSQR
jgi:tetratricopeptide (TPR) repeat protein